MRQLEHLHRCGKRGLRDPGRRFFLGGESVPHEFRGLGTALLLGTLRCATLVAPRTPKPCSSEQLTPVAEWSTDLDTEVPNFDAKLNDLSYLTSTHMQSSSEARCGALVSCPPRMSLE